MLPDAIRPVTDAAVNTIADKVGNLVGTLWDYSFGLVVNIIFLSRKADEVAEEMESLQSLRDDLMRRAEDDVRQTRANVSNQLERWVSRVASLAEDAANFQRSFDGGSTCITRFRLGYDVVELLKQARKLDEEGIKVFSGGGAPLTCPRGPDPVEQVPSETLSSTLVGGREALHQVQSWIMDDGVGIIGIYGMGGVGKTTLLKIINNDFLRGETCRDKFDVAIWVTVSQDVQISSIRETVARRLGLSSNTSRDELFRHLSEKRFILLLDDVWRKLDLVETGIPHPQTVNHSGKILFTTRYEQVCGEMDADQMVKINSLDDGSSWELFRSKLGRGAAVLDNNPSIRQLAEEVVGRCGGLPIALITVGRAMSSAKTAYEWNDAIRKLDQCAAELSPGMEQVLKSLKFSFEKLKDEAHRNCLLYCALFPEDVEISTEEIINYWIGEGFLDPEDFDEDNIEDTRCRGYVLIRNLQNACLLEETFLGTYNGTECVKLHDTVRDMALWIAGHDFVVLARSLRNAFPSQPVPKLSIWENARKISMINYYNIDEPPSSSFPNLTTLLLRYSSWRYFTSFTSMPALRVLDLCGTSLNTFPIEITSLTSLQYLSLLRNLFSALPVELGNLTNLRILILGPSWNLTSIPAEAISRLSHLQVLDMNCPCQFGDPSETQVVSDMNCSRWQFSYPPQVELSDLANLKRLSELYLPALYSWASLGVIAASPVLRRSTRNLYISFFSFSPPPLPPPPPGDTISGQIGRLSDLRSLELSPNRSDPPPPPPRGDTISDQICSLSDLRTLHLKANPSDPVMGELQLYPISRLHQNLEVLHIQHFKEAKFCINNITCHGSEPLFPRLCVLSIKNCDGCSELTWVGRLPCLAKLKVTDCKGFRDVMMPLDGGGSHDHHPIMPPSFPKLKDMILSRLPSMRSISTSTLLFPCLERLSVRECPRLQRLPLGPQSAKNLRTLKIYRCDECSELTWVGRLPCLEELHVGGCEGLREVMMLLDGGGSHDHHPIMQSSFPKLKTMYLRDLPSLRSSSTSTLLFPCLERLYVDGCPQLQRLPFGAQSTKNLQLICGPKTWWDRLEWDDHAHQQSFSSKFQEWDAAAAEQLSVEWGN